MDNQGKIGIDMINVGKGDALFIELHDQNGTPYIICVDGGTQEHGDTLSKHATTYFGNKIDIVISTHPDTDHIGGLSTILEKSTVTYLVLNDPRDYYQESALLSIAKSSFTSEQYALFKSSFDRIDDLKSIAGKNSVKIISLFGSNKPVGTVGEWNLFIVNPSQQLFSDLWGQEDTIKNWFSTDIDDVNGLEKTGNSIIDDPNIDTAPINNTSIMLFIEGYGRKYLFTGDAGKKAIREASKIKDLSGLSWLDVPHHGSRRNVDSAILKYFSPSVAYISSPGTTKHPRKTVIKKLQEVGTEVYSTCKTKGSLYHHRNLPNRTGYSKATPWEKL